MVENNLSDYPECSNAVILQYLNADLPETEDRIGTQMDPNCEVSVVIPAYGEWDFLFRPLESLSGQEGVSPDQYEVIIVVNNPPGPPSVHDGETSTFYQKRLDHYHRASLENKKTIDLIRYINGEDVNLDLTDTERSKADSLKNSGLRLFCVDKASPGKTLVGDDANVGGARNRGVAEAIERFYKLGRNGIVAQSDADTRCDAHYVRGLIEVFEESPQLVGLAGAVKLDDSSFGDKLLRLSSLHTRLNVRYDYMLNLLLRSRGLVQEKEKPAEEVGFCGANMASRAFETAIVGGVPKISNQEDTEFGRRLSKVGEVRRDNRVVTMPADRLSARTGTHGHGYRKLSVADSIAERGSIYVPDPASLVEGITDGVAEIPLEEATVKLISIFCGDERLKSFYESSRAELIKAEELLYRDRMRIVEMLLDTVFNDGREGFNVESLVQTIDLQKGTFGIDIAEDEFLGDLSKGFVVSSKFVEIVVGSETKDAAIHELQSVFVEDLNPLDKNPVLLRSLELKAMNNAVRQSYLV